MKRRVLQAGMGVIAAAAMVMPFTIGGAPVHAGGSHCGGGTTSSNGVYVSQDVCGGGGTGGGGGIHCIYVYGETSQGVLVNQCNGGGTPP